jgi:hypothetical protein
MQWFLQGFFISSDWMVASICDSWEWLWNILVCKSSAGTENFNCIFLWVECFTSPTNHMWNTFWCIFYRTARPAMWILLAGRSWDSGVVETGGWNLTAILCWVRNGIRSMWNWLSWPLSGSICLITMFVFGVPVFPIWYAVSQLGGGGGLCHTMSSYEMLFWKGCTQSAKVLPIQ